MARFPYPDYENPAFKAVGKSTINILKLLSYSRSTVDAWGKIGNAHFTSLELPKKLRELVILFSTAKFNSAYEFRHHIPMSCKFGVTDTQRAELVKAAQKSDRNTKHFGMAFGQSDNTAVFDDREKLLLEFLEVVIDDGEVEEELWGRVVDKLSKREIVEILSMHVS